MNIFKKMNGYQRIAVVLSLAWIMLNFNTVLSAPAKQHEYIEKFERLDIAKALLNTVEGIKKDYPYDFSIINSFDHLDEDSFIKTIVEKFPTGKSEVEKVVSGYNWLRFKAYFSASLVMLAPPVCLYILASALGWAVAGFRKTNQ